jgi:hypothetical protein
MEMELIVGLIFGSLIAVLSSSGIFFLYIKLFTGKTVSYRVMEPIGNRFYILKKGKTKMVNTEFKFKDFTYKIDMNKSIDDKRRFSVEKILYYEKDKSEPLSFIKPDKFFDSKTFKAYIENKDYQDLMKDSAQEKIYLMLIIGLVVALVAVVVYSQYTSSQLNDKIISLMRNITMPKPSSTIVR